MLLNPHVHVYYYHETILFKIGYLCKLSKQYNGNTVSVADAFSSYMYQERTMLIKIEHLLTLQILSTLSCHSCMRGMCSIKTQHLSLANFSTVFTKQSSSLTADNRCRGTHSWTAVSASSSPTDDSMVKVKRRIT